MDEAKIPAHQQPTRKISLSQQIEEVEKELERRKSEYPRLIAREKLRQSVADYQMERLWAVRGTLKWLQENEDFVRRAIGNRDAIRRTMDTDDA